MAKVTKMGGERRVSLDHRDITFFYAMIQGSTLGALYEVGDHVEYPPDDVDALKALLEEYFQQVQVK